MSRTERLTREETSGEASDRDATWLVRVGSAHEPSLGPAVIPLGERFLIGRDHQPELQDPWMSGEHAEVVLEDGGYWLRDLGSSNGTSRFGARVSAIELDDGDVFETGGTFWMFFARPGPPPPAPAGEPLATVNPPLRELLDRATKLARTRVPIMLLGETGSGKEVVAREIHRASRRTGAFIAIHAASLQKNLIASELFGVERGAHSMAESARPGQVRAAEGGTLLLDEIGDMPAEVQVAILRMLQEGEITPVGADRPIKVDARVVCATHQDLSAMVATGAFRADLYARLNGALLRLPPLRERREDLGILIAALVARHASEPIGFQPAAYRALLIYDWPLNVRELEKAIEMAVALAEGGKVKLEHLPEEVRRFRREEASPALSREQKKKELVRLLEKNKGNASAVARAMGKSRMQIHRYFKEFGIDPEQYR